MAATDFTWNGANLTIDIPAAGANDCVLLPICAKDVGAPNTITGIPAGFTLLVTAPGIENRGLLYGRNGAGAAQTITLNSSAAMEWGAGATLRTGKHVAVVGPPSATVYGGDPPTYPMVTPAIVANVASSEWIQMLFSSNYSRWYTPDAGAGTTRALVLHSGSYIGFALGVNAVGAGDTGDSDSWTASYTDGGAADGASYVGASLILEPPSSSVVVTIGGEVDLSDVTSISATPTSLAPTVSGTATITFKDQTGTPLAGVQVTSLSPSLATVTTPSNSLGQVLVTGVAAGSTSVVGSYTDATNGLLTATVTVAVALSTAAAPSGLTAVAQSATSVALAWTDNASSETGQRMERATAPGGPWTTVASPASNVVTLTDTTVAPQTTYYYRVFAVNGSGDSASSNVATVTTPQALDTTPPTCGLTLSSGTVTASNVPVSLTATVADNRGVVLVRFYRDGVEFTSVPVAPIPNTAAPVVQQLVFASAASNGTYQYQARAFDAAGNSTMSAAVSLAVAIPAAGVIPNAPSGLTAVATGSNAIQLAFTRNGTNEDGFYVERKSGPGSFVQVQQLAAGVVEWEDTGLLAGTAYTYRVRAFGSGGASGYTAEASATTVAPPMTVLASVSASVTQVSDVTGSSATITYTARDGNGSVRPGVGISPTIADPAVATVTPSNAVTDSTGRAFVTVTFGSIVSQTVLTVEASDGTATLSGAQNPQVDVFTLPAFTDTLLRELLAEQQDPKYADEIQPYVFDFSPWLGRDETIQSILLVESIPVNGQDRDPDSADMIFGAARTAGTRVLQFFRDGLPGQSYYLRVQVRTTIGRTPISEIRIRVYKGKGNRVSSSSPVVD